MRFFNDTNRRIFVSVFATVVGLLALPASAQECLIGQIEFITTQNPDGTISHSQRSRCLLRAPVPSTPYDIGSNPACEARCVTANTPTVPGVDPRGVNELIDACFKRNCR